MFIFIFDKCSMTISLLKKVDYSLNLWHARSFDNFDIWHEAEFCPKGRAAED